MVVVAVKDEKPSSIGSLLNHARTTCQTEPNSHDYIKIHFLFFSSLVLLHFPALPVSIVNSSLCSIQRMTLFSSPSYTTMPRNRACLFATDPRSTERTVYLPVPFCLILIASRYHHSTTRLFD